MATGAVPAEAADSQRYRNIVRVQILPEWERSRLSAISHADVVAWVAKLIEAGDRGRAHRGGDQRRDDLRHPEDTPVPIGPGPPLLRRRSRRARRRKGPDDLVFTTPRGDVMRNHNFRSRVFVPAAKQIGMPGLTPHDLRHTAASLAVQAGAKVKAVQRMLGHASAAMTLDVYAGLFGDDLDAVADRLDAAAAAARADSLRTETPKPDVLPLDLGGQHAP